MDSISVKYGLLNFFGNTQCSYFANVRFDIRQEDPIYYHQNFTEATDSVNAHFPNPKLSYPDRSTGSDALRVIERFYENDQVPLCGSVVIMFLSRFPNETDIARTVAKVRQYNGVVSVLLPLDSTGGLQPKTMYNVASKTNGIAAFEWRNNYSEAVLRFPTFYRFPVYAQNMHVSGEGFEQMPPF